MNHADEMACLLYLEGQLDSSRAREFLAHTSECVACGNLLRALEHESQFLSASLAEDDEALPARLLNTRSWSMPSWAWTLAFAAFAAGAYTLWSDGISPWLDQFSNAGFGGTDLVSMILFIGAFWGGWGTMTNIAQISAFMIIGLGGTAMLARRLRRATILAVIVSALLLALAMPQPAAAAEVRRGKSITIQQGETIHNDLIVAGPSVRIDGTIDGDLIAFTRDLTVTGHVTGDVIAFTNQMRVDGTVDGNLRAFCNSLILEGSVAKNAIAFANTFDLTSKGTIGGSLLSFMNQATLDGKIGRDLLGFHAHTYVDGDVGGQFWLRGESLAIASSAEFDSAAKFVGREQPVVSPGAKFASPIQFEMSQENRRARRSTMRRVLHAIFSYGAALLVGIVIVTVFPGFYRTAVREAGSIGPPIGIGALALLIGAFLLIMGILLLFVGVGAGIAAVMVYAPILYLAQVIVGGWLGEKAMKKRVANPGEPIGHVALGLLILHIFGAIPVVGSLMWLAVGLWGTGSVLMGFYSMSRVHTVAVPA